MNLPRVVRTGQSQKSVSNVWHSAMIVLVAIAFPGNLQSQSVEPITGQSKPVKIEIEIDKTEAQVAEQIQMKITATAPQNVTVKLPEMKQQLGEFEVTAVKDTLDIPVGSERSWIRHVYLESLVSGKLEIPSIEISYVDRRGPVPATGLQSTPVQFLSIRSALEGVEDPTQFRDIKSVEFAPEAPPRNRFWLGVTAVACGIVFVAACAIVMLRRKSEPSPKHRAIQSLDELRESQAFQDNETKQVYERTVGILRTFVDRQFGISAPRLTTNEFLQAMQSDDRLTAEFRSGLSDLLHLADMVKFAGMLPASNQLSTVVDQARQLIENASEVETPGLHPDEVRSDTLTDADTRRPLAEDK